MLTACLHGGDGDADEVSVSKKIKLTSGSTSTKKQSKAASKENSSMKAVSIAESLTETNKLLQRMYLRMDKYEERMRHIEDKSDGQSSCPSSSGSTPARKRSKEVPLEVRVSSLYSELCVHNVTIYMLDSEDKENSKGEAWGFSGIIDPIVFRL